MKFSAREDIEAPIGDVFRSVTDFAVFERRMMARGVEIERDGSFPLDQIGAQWKAAFTWRGRRYDVDAKLTSIDPGEGYAIESRSNGVECLAVVDLMSLSQSRTRMFVSLDLKPQTLSARLLLQSLRLAKGTLTSRFKARVHEFANRL